MDQTFWSEGDKTLEGGKEVRKEGSLGNKEQRVHTSESEGPENLSCCIQREEVVKLGHIYVLFQV